MYKKLWPLLAAITLYGYLMTGLITDSVRRNGGRFVYALDDPYIHMAIAKNFAQHGVWGVTAEGFTSSTSAPLWTLLLAVAYRLFGVNDLTPLILNIVAAVALLVLVYQILAHFTQRSWLIFLTLLVILFVTPLPALTLTGMEHILHAVLSVAFAYEGARIVAAPRPPSFRSWLLLLILAILLSTVRYEGLFLIGAVALLLLVRRKLTPAVGIGLAGLLPPVVYGWVSAMQGWMFLPNSLMLKSDALMGPSEGWFQATLIKFLKHADDPTVFSLLIVLPILCLLLWKRQDLLCAQALNITALIAIFFHLAFAGLGWFYRYEAYLVALGLTSSVIALANLMPKEKMIIRLDTAIFYAIVLLGLALVMAFWPRISHSLRDAPIATANIHEQQIQMAKFADRYYSGQAIAANDIGALSYYTDAHVLDLFGLGSLEPARLKLQGRYDTTEIARLVGENNVQVVMVYDTWFQEFGGLPTRWIKVGEWEIQNNVVCGSEVVSFYAPNDTALPYLRDSLDEFSAQLPHDVKFWFAK